MSLGRHGAWTAAAFLTLMVGGEAVAACTSFPMPGVEWRRCLHDGANFDGVDISGGDLRDAFFRRANFDGSVLAGIRARRAKFTSASMVGVDLSNADLTLAEFTTTDLTGASLEGATLRRASFVNAILRDVNFTSANTLEAEFGRADLSGATWTDGQTICAEGSIGVCHAIRPETTGDVSN